MIVQRVGLRHVEQLRRHGGLAGLKHDCGGGQVSFCPPLRVRCRQGGAFKECRLSGDAAALLRPVCRSFQLARDVLVGFGQILSQVPCAAIRIGARMSSLRECAVRMLPVPQPSGTVGRRPDHGVPEDDPAVERDQSGLGGRERGATGDPQLPGRPPDQCRIAGGIGRRDEQELAGLGRKPAELSEQGV